MSAVTVIVIVVQLFQFCLGFNANYKGFDSCGFGGWHCQTFGEEFEVSYECSSETRDARLWIWTARVPHSTTILSVKNCRRVELHMDCTMGYRSYTLKRFHADNITVLELLRPLRPHIFLHDNDMYSQAPPELLFTNINTLKWYPENFKAASGRCRKRSQKLQRLIFQNVFIAAWANSLFQEQQLNTLYLSSVRFGSIKQSESLSVDGNILIKDSRLDNLIAGSLKFSCVEMLINGSSFSSIARGGISVEAKYFSFINNAVTKADGGSFVVTAQTTRFVNNTWGLISAKAFGEIRPNRSCEHGNVYEFRDNQIDYLENDFAPDMQAFNKSQCSYISLAHNVFPCDHGCSFSESNINPLNYDKLLGQFTNFSNDNSCKDDPRKSVKESITEIAIACGLLPTPTVPEPSTTESTTELTETTTEDVSATSETTARFNDPIVMASPYKGARIALPLSVGGVLLIAAVAATTFWIYKKRNEERKNTVATYHNTSRSFDQDQLIDDPEEEDREEEAITIQSI